ncbi:MULTISPECIES: replication-associated recombination protein A [Sphingobacterium]|uniref:replication-associated recombination protein A n=1 Tax=Sphingobacterium TaxID=28453 RepID=UPI0008A5F58D|nr:MULTISPECIES: replication-associated recombination protein A [Sphingobacterium]HAF33236.1 replication-associated recombination protein A [Sphingobacterium sp.]OFV14199.1 AAA family ATPase [Sphingobacterium sp. HMSC13C05]HAL53484.1 replication-associated recombination protein A [Sphingobacterium sp.]HAT93411.1 replication-associated recombination protein A [Sphingobacterium sp.]HBI88887.1 replication-associated recombination protein A [Sphingobacterium sp.]
MATRIPLAERLRPRQLSDYVGQQHIVGPDAVLYHAIQQKNIPSMILWGPPGVGKTSLALLIARALDRPFFSLSAIQAGVKDIREVIEKAERLMNFNQDQPILFIDEIHRFSKSQQDSLLGAVERGLVTLIGATTENPSFEVISALLSRCQVYVLEHLSEQDLIGLIQKALHEDEYLQKQAIVVEEYEALLRLSGGDARKLLNVLELVVNAAVLHKEPITNAFVLKQVQQNMAIYDKAGEQHYDIISAFIKSIRGSDPNAAVYWLARMIEGGEDPSFIARRLLILASEDIGNANPNALLLANNCFQAVNVIGWPESRIILSQTVIYLATSVKSNASYEAINKAQALVKQTGDLSVPLHIRNAPTKLMKDLNYGAEYKYAHAYPGNFVVQEFLPKEISGVKLYEPGQNSQEEKLRQSLRDKWKEKYKY